MGCVDNPSVFPLKSMLIFYPFSSGPLQKAGSWKLSQLAACYVPYGQYFLMADISLAADLFLRPAFPAANALLNYQIRDCMRRQAGFQAEGLR